ncbi:MAG: hypothetical protein ACI4JS_07400 [Oscillospiraceae bacterium]
MEEIIISKKCLNDTPKGIMIVSGMVSVACFIFSELFLLEICKRLSNLYFGFVIDGGIRKHLENLETKELREAMEAALRALMKSDNVCDLLNNWRNVYLAVCIFCAVLFVASFVMFVLNSKSEINVTNKRLYGKNSFGQSVNIPLDTISAVAASEFNTLIITAPSSKNFFIFLPDDYKNVSEEITQLVLKSKESLKSENRSAGLN